MEKLWTCPLRSCHLFKSSCYCRCICFYLSRKKKKDVKCQGQLFPPSRRKMLTLHLFSVFHNCVYTHTVHHGITLNWTETHSALSNITSNNLQPPLRDEPTEEMLKPPPPPLWITLNVKWKKPDKPADICLRRNLLLSCNTTNWNTTGLNGHFHPECPCIALLSQGPHKDMNDTRVNIEMDFRISREKHISVKTGHWMVMMERRVKDWDRRDWDN